MPNKTDMSTPFELSRRDALKTVGCGFGYLAFAALATEQARAESPLLVKKPHFEPRAKRVIFLSMRGAPSHVDTFDYKPRLTKDSGTPGRYGRGGTLLGSPWKFEPRGKSGLWISELFPPLSKRADDLCMLRGMHSDPPNHPQATAQTHTGSFQFSRPSMGAWTLYGLGTENANLPGFLVLNPAPGDSNNYASSFLPAIYQGTRMRAPGSAGGRRGGIMAPEMMRRGSRRGEGRRGSGRFGSGRFGSGRFGSGRFGRGRFGRGRFGRGRDNSPAESFPDIRNRDLDSDLQRLQLDLIQELNRGKLERDVVQPEVEGMIESFELAFRMQSEMPEALDTSGESRATLDMYGIGESQTDSFGRQCLLARRMVERGVRFVECVSQGWDHHRNLEEEMEDHCAQIDKPIAALLRDLAQRKLLDDTLVIWAGEFGRTPHAQNGNGRDHNNKGYTTWMAGGGVKGGFSYGSTDDHGYEAVEGKCHIHDWHATILHLLGLDHEKLTFRYAGRDFRLTDVHGSVIGDVIA